MRLFDGNEVWLENTFMLENARELLNSGTVIIIETVISREIIDIR